jgi:hypothetical protein
MSDDIFVAAIAFQDAVRDWEPRSRTQRHRDHDKTAFIKHITTEEDYEKFKELSKNRDSNLRLGPWLDENFREVKTFTSPQVTVVSEGPGERSLAEIIADPPKLELVSKAPKVSTGGDPGVEAAFSSVWDAWPKNEKSGKRSSARTAFFETCRSRDLEQVVKVCEFYIKKFSEPNSGMTHPYNLVNFLTDDERFDTWVQKLQGCLTPDEEADFDAMYARYLRWKTLNQVTSREDAAAVWKRHIKPEDRLKFYFYVRAYSISRYDAWQADPGSATFTKNFVGFVGSFEHLQKDEEITPEAIRLAGTLMERTVADVIIAEDYAGTRKFRNDNTADMGQTLLWNFMCGCLTNWDPKFNIEATIRTYVANIPKWAAEEGRANNPQVEKLKDPNNRTILRDKILAQLRLNTHTPPANRTEPIKFPPLWPQDPEWVAQQKAEKERKEAEEHAKRVKNVRASVLENDRYEKCVSDLIYQDAIDAINSLPQPYRQMAWFFAGPIHMNFSNYRPYPNRPVAVFDMLISSAAEDCRINFLGPEFPGYIDALRSVREELPPDPVDKPVIIEGPIVLNFNLKVRDDDEDNKNEDLQTTAMCANLVE